MRTQEEVKKEIGGFLRRFQSAYSNSLSYEEIEEILFKISDLFNDLSIENKKGETKVIGTIEDIKSSRRNISNEKKIIWARERAEDLYRDLRIHFN